MDAPPGTTARPPSSAMTNAHRPSRQLTAPLLMSVLSVGCSSDLIRPPAPFSCLSAAQAPEGLVRLEFVGQFEQRSLVAVPTHELHADRQSLRRCAERP